MYESLCHAGGAIAGGVTRLTPTTPPPRNRKRLRRYWRVAQKLARYHQVNNQSSKPRSGRSLAVDSEVWPQTERIERLHQLLETCDGYGWSAAASRIRSRLRQAYLVLVRQAENAIESIDDSLDYPVLASPGGPPTFQSPRDLFADLKALEGDFASVEVGRRLQSISVVTDPIELEGLYLGPFEIELWCDPWPFRYEIIARDPQPAARSDSYTHPHVCNGNLCEGEGVAAIRQSLMGGRLFDFFTIVRQILETYSSHSAFVSIDDWQGTECYECGDLISAEEIFVCDGCRCDLCEQCQRGCHRCDASLCAECKKTCSKCDHVFCADCSAHCPTCGNRFCLDCLNETPNHERLCDDCFEAKQASMADPEPESESSDTAQAAV